MSIDTNAGAGAPQVEVTSPAGRTAEAPPRRRFAEAMRAAGGVILGGVESAAGFTPGGSILSATASAARGAVAGAGGGNVGGATAALSDGSGLDEENPAELLRMQAEINREQQHYAALSNVLKARHDTAKQVINNVR